MLELQISMSSAHNVGDYATVNLALKCLKSEGPDGVEMGMDSTMNSKDTMKQSLEGNVKCS